MVLLDGGSHSWGFIGINGILRYFLEERLIGENLPNV